MLACCFICPPLLFNKAPGQTSNGFDECNKNNNHRFPRLRVTSMASKPHASGQQAVLGGGLKQKDHARSAKRRHHVIGRGTNVVETRRSEFNPELGMSPRRDLLPNSFAAKHPFAESLMP